MSLPVFTPRGDSYLISYVDDSTEFSKTIPAATALLCVNADTANVVVVSVGFVSGDVDAIVPPAIGTGEGTVIAPGGSILLHIPQAAYNATMYVSGAGVSASGNIFITPGSFYNG